MRDVTLSEIFEHRIAQKYLNRSGLAHAIAVAYHAFHLAKEQNVDVDAAAKAGLLHDIGHFTWYRNGRWDYDYVSSGYSSKQNLYLFASSTQKGLYSWNMPKNVNGFYASTRLDVEVTFGAGTYGGTHRLSDRGSYNLGSTFKSKKIIWN